MPSPRARIPVVAVVVVAGLVPAAAMADTTRQGVPVATVQYYHSGAVTIEGAAGEAWREPLELDGHTIRVAARSASRFEGGKTVLVVAGQYDLTLLAWRKGTDARRQDTYHFPAVRVALLQNLREPWGLMTYALVGVASDMARVDAADVRFAVGAGVTYSVSPEFGLVLGATYTNSFDAPRPLPLVDVTYRTGRARFQLRVPNSASIWLSLGQSLDLGLLAGMLNLRYGLHTPIRVADEYGVLDVTLGPAARVFLWQGVYLQGGGGWAVRSFRLRQQEQLTYNLLTFSGWYLSASFGYAI